MAKKSATKKKNEKSFEATLWDTANSLRGTVEPSDNCRDISVYGQERGISANLGDKPASTFQDDQHKAEKFDFIMANPPFNQSKWRQENELLDDPRWKGFSVLPTSNANYGCILNIFSKLSTNGVAGFLLANGALSEEAVARKEVENVFKSLGYEI